MPAKGKPAVNKDKKARILAKKALQMGTQSKIAKEERVSRKTVNAITPERVDMETLELAADYKQVLAKKAGLNVDVGLDIMHERMFSPESRLSEITGAVKISHDILQIQTGQPTQITLDLGMEKCRDFVRQFLQVAKNFQITEELIEGAYQGLMVASIDVPEDIRVKYVEQERKKAERLLDTESRLL